MPRLLKEFRICLHIEQHQLQTYLEQVLSNQILTTLKLYNIHLTQVIYSTSDNGSSMLKATSILSLQNFFTDDKDEDQFKINNTTYFSQGNWRNALQRAPNSYVPQHWKFKIMLPNTGLGYILLKIGLTDCRDQWRIFSVRIQPSRKQHKTNFGF